MIKNFTTVRNLNYWEINIDLTFFEWIYNTRAIFRTYAVIVHMPYHTCIM